MHSLNLSPDIYSYNLLLRCIKNCGAGDPQLTSRLLDGDTAALTKKENTANKIKSIKQRVIQIDCSQTHDVAKKSNNLDNTVSREDSNGNLQQANAENSDTNYKMVKVVREIPHNGDQDAIMPNLLGQTLTTGKVVGLGPLDQPHDRYGSLLCPLV